MPKMSFSAFSELWAETSGLKVYLNSIAKAKAIDTETVHIITKRPNPLLPNMLAFLFIMDESWAKQNDALAPQNLKAQTFNPAVLNANGTGPFKLVIREPDVRTILIKNGHWWDLAQHPHNIDKLVFMPIANSATRAAALFSGEIDLLLDPPLQDLERIKATVGLKLKSTHQLRTIFLGMDQSISELRSSNIKGKNPLADKRVRKAFYHGIDIETIKDKVMRSWSIPAGIIAPPGVNGHTPELDQRLPFDPSTSESAACQRRLCRRVRAHTGLS